MTRRLFNVAAFASLALFLATVGLWVRGRWRADVFAVGHESSIWAFQGSFMWWEFEPPAEDWSGAHVFSHSSLPVNDAMYVRSMVEEESQWDTKWDRMGLHGSAERSRTAVAAPAWRR